MVIIGVVASDFVIDTQLDTSDCGVSYYKAAVRAEGLPALLVHLGVVVVADVDLVFLGEPAEQDTNGTQIFAEYGATEDLTIGLTVFGEFSSPDDEVEARIGRVEEGHDDRREPGLAEQGLEAEAAHSRDQRVAVGGVAGAARFFR